MHDYICQVTCSTIFTAAKSTHILVKVEADTVPVVVYQVCGPIPGTHDYLITAVSLDEGVREYTNQT